jgi:hypothetical protein
MPYPVFSRMAVETIEEALDAGWRVQGRCAWGKHDGMKSIRDCVYGAGLDLATLMWTTGRAFPLTGLGS